MSQNIKMKEDELLEVHTLRDKFQKKIIQLGQLNLQRLQAESTLKQIAEQEPVLEQDWINLQKEENQLIDKLLKTYGEGSLDLQSGTFVSEAKPV